VKIYIEEFFTTFSGFHQTIFSFLTAYSLQLLFSQLTAHSNFFHSHSPTKQTLRVEVPTSWSPQIIELGFNASLIIELIMDSKFLP
jgi:hypothetical protein